MKITHPLKPVRMWAVSHWRAGIYADTVSRTRKTAISSFQEIYGVDDLVWRGDRSAGVHRAIPVLVTPILKVKA